jgi:hypothetical protein
MKNNKHKRENKAVYRITIITTTTTTTTTNNNNNINNAIFNSSKVQRLKLI